MNVGSDVPKLPLATSWADSDKKPNGLVAGGRPSAAGVTGNFTFSTWMKFKAVSIWTVIAGSGHTIVDGMEQPVKPGDVVTMAAGCKHTVIAGPNGLQMIEVQLGSDISVSDKKKYEFPYK